MISLEKWLTLTPLQKLPKNVGDLDKIIVAKGLKIAQSPINRPIWSHCEGHTMLTPLHTVVEWILNKKIKKCGAYNLLSQIVCSIATTALNSTIVAFCLPELCPSLPTRPELRSGTWRTSSSGATIPSPKSPTPHTPPSMERLPKRLFFIKMGQSRRLFVYFRRFHMTQIKYKLIKALMARLGLKPGAEGCMA